MMHIQNIKLELPRVFFLIIITTAILLRVYNIGYNLDGDEVGSVSASSSTFSHMVERAAEDRSHPPLHPALLFIWIKFLGNSEVSVRIFSIAVSFLFLIIVYRLALLLMPVWAALFVLTLYSLSPFFIYYGQQARPYSLLSFLSAISFYLLLKYQNKPSTIKAVWYSFTCVALLYTSYLSVFILIPQFIYVAFFNKQGGKKLVFCGAIGASSILYWIFSSSLLQNVGRLEEKIYWLAKPNFISFLNIYIEPFGWSPFPGASKWLFCIISLILISLIINWQVINRRNVILLTALAFFGPIVIFILSVYGRFSIWASRQMIGEIIFYILLLGLALSTLPKRPRIILGMILISWCTINIHNEFPENAKPPWRYMANLISAKYTDYYIIVQDGGIKDPLQYYMKKEVNYFSPESLKTQGKVIFVCYPDRCDRLKEISLSHKIIDKKVVSWSRYERISTNKIILYFLEKRS
jgi:uncharacterized membrane protein